MSCIINRNGNFRDLNSIIEDRVEEGQPFDQVRQKVKENNVELLESFGCSTPELIEEGFAFFLSLSLEATFNAWSNEDEGTSGISARALLSEATTPGAILALVGLLKAHPKAKASGDVNISYSNPSTRGARR